MKKIFTLLSILVLSAAAYAQIPNASFETWSNGEPTGWNAFEGPSSIIQTTNAEAGTYAAKLIPQVVLGYAIAPALATINADDNSDYFPITTTPVSFTGWYILDVADSDNLLIATTVKNSNNTDSGYILTRIFSPTATYKQFAYNFYYVGAGSTDSGAISFWLNTKGGSPEGIDSNDYFIIDNLAFSQTSAGIEDINKGVAVLEPCSPNPANNIANIIYSIPVNGTVTVALYDITGRKIETLLNNAVQSSGRYKIPTDVTGLSSGVYFYTLTVNGQTFTQKIIVTH